MCLSGCTALRLHAYTRDPEYMTLEDYQALTLGEIALQAATACYQRRHGRGEWLHVADRKRFRPFSTIFDHLDRLDRYPLCMHFLWSPMADHSMTV